MVAVEMLFSSALVGLVGAAEHPDAPSYEVRLWNTQGGGPSGASVCDPLTFPEPVLGVRMNRERLLAILASKVHVFELASMRLLHSVDTSHNPRGLGCISSDSSPGYSALVGGADAGSLFLFDTTQLVALGTVSAHRHALACMGFSSCGRLVATASLKGTVVRVHICPSGQLAHTCRRV